MTRWGAAELQQSVRTIALQHAQQLQPVYITKKHRRATRKQDAAQKKGSACGKSPGRA